MEMEQTPKLYGPAQDAASGQTKKLVILLHGLGSNGYDLFGLVPELAPALPDVAFASPHAPFPCDMAPVGHQWFSLRSREETALRMGAEQAEPILNSYIDAQIEQHKLQPKDVALLGFSQGTMTSLFVALRRAEPLAGIVGFSGAMISAAKLPKEIKAKPPICLIHGEQDDVVPFTAMEIAERSLQAAGVSVETHPRPQLAHSIDREGLDAAIDFLKRVLG
jgi:phospholipase/carboxylesterase